MESHAPKTCEGMNIKENGRGGQQELGAGSKGFKTVEDTGIKGSLKSTKVFVCKATN